MHQSLFTLRPCRVPLTNIRCTLRRQTGAYVDLHSNANVNQTSNDMSLQSDAIFEAIKERVAADQPKAKAINAIFLYKITKNGTVAKDWSEFNF